MNNARHKRNISYDIIGIGNILLDINVNIDNDTLLRLDIVKGSSILITREESEMILKELGDCAKHVSPGGSAANTLTGINILGNRAALIGVVGDDDNGRLYRQITEKSGVVSHLKIDNEQATGHSFIMITPDGERTMATHLGAALCLDKFHIDEDAISASKFLHIEAYQLEDPRLFQINKYAMDAAKKYGVSISLDLSDAGLVNRNKNFFKDVVREYIDIVFANENEAYEFTGKEEVDALDEIANVCSVAVVKLGARGSFIKSSDRIYKIEPHRVSMVNTSGAGDMYAAGVLHGLINNLDLQTAGDIASHVSALVVASSSGRLDEKYFPEIERHKYHSKK